MYKIVRILTLLKEPIMASNNTNTAKKLVDMNDQELFVFCSKAVSTERTGFVRAVRALGLTPETHSDENIVQALFDTKFDKLVELRNEKKANANSTPDYASYMQGRFGQAPVVETQEQPITQPNIIPTQAGTIVTPPPATKL